MSRSELAARRWLRIDAFYCAAAGALAVSLCVPLARFFDVPVGVVGGSGVATIVWAWLLLRLAAGEHWREPLRLVGAANAAASAGLAVLAALSPAAGSRLLLVAVAIEVAAFAAVQLRTLRR